MLRRFAYRFAPLIAFCLLAGVIGCSSKGTVSGKVSLRGQPIMSGFVTLIGSDGIQYVGEISEGTYSIPGVPSGPAKFTVTSPNPNPSERIAGARRIKTAGATDAGGEDEAAAAQSPTPEQKAWFPLPEKYGDPAQSGLTGTVRSNTVIDLELN